MNWFTTKTPLIIGHRGASAEAPENTLAAFALALEQGADGIELDVQLTADGWLAVFHDLTLERLTTGTGRVTDKTLAELQSLALKEEQTIPSLNEVFELLGKRLLYNVEIKDFGWRDRGTETAVAECIRTHGLEEHVLISSFNPFCVRRARRALSRTTAVALLRENNWLKIGHNFAATQADHPHYPLVNQESMAWAKQKGLLVNVWTVDDPAEGERLQKLGVNGIVTNKPQFMRQNLGL